VPFISMTAFNTTRLRSIWNTRCKLHSISLPQVTSDKDRMKLTCVTVQTERNVYLLNAAIGVWKC